MATRCAAGAAVSAVVVIPATAAKVLLSAESHSAIVTDVPVKANRCTYICAPKASEAAVSTELAADAAVAPVSVRLPGVSCRPHSSPKPLACKLTAPISEPSVARVQS